MANVTMAEYIRAHQLSKTMAEVARRTKLTRRQCSSRAYRARKHGVKLKLFSPGPVNWKELAELACSLGGRRDSRE